MGTMRQLATARTLCLGSAVVLSVSLLAANGLAQDNTGGLKGTSPFGTLDRSTFDPIREGRSSFAPWRAASPSFDGRAGPSLMDAPLLFQSGGKRPNSPPSADPATILRLKARAREALATGDITSARAYLAEATSERDGEALDLMAQTYDPDVLAQVGVVGIRGDREMAAALRKDAAYVGSGSPESVARP